MKKIFLFIFLFIFPSVAFSQPSIEFKTESYDFGTGPTGDKNEHSFDFKNSGNEDLEIKRLSSS
jgi:hypothetical protein